MSACVRACVRACLRACVPAFVPACVRACVRVCVCVCCAFVVVVSILRNVKVLGMIVRDVLCLLCCGEC